MCHHLYQLKTTGIEVKKMNQDDLADALYSMYSSRAQHSGRLEALDYAFKESAINGLGGYSVRMVIVDEFDPEYLSQKLVYDTVNCSQDIMVNSDIENSNKNVSAPLPVKNYW